MLVGSANLETLAATAPAIERFATEPLRLESVETLQVFSEIASDGTEELLPPALHPTVPPAVTWLVQRVPESPWGAFHLAQLRIECRSGLRPRGFLRAALIDNPRAAAELEARWGFAVREGVIDLRRAYDSITARVSLEGREILDVGLRAPEPLGTTDVYYAASMHLARTPNGLRLIQFDPEHHVTRAERGRPFVASFDATTWRSQGVCPSYPVSASFTVASVVFPPVRWVCRPDVLAFYGTERVGT